MLSTVSLSKEQFSFEESGSPDTSPEPGVLLSRKSTEASQSFASVPAGTDADADAQERAEDAPTASLPPTGSLLAIKPASNEGVNLWDETETPEVPVEVVRARTIEEIMAQDKVGKKEAQLRQQNEDGDILEAAMQAEWKAKAEAQQKRSEKEQKQKDARKRYKRNLIIGLPFSILGFLSIIGFFILGGF